VANGGAYQPPHHSQYVNAVVYPGAPSAHLTELGPSDPSGPGPRGPKRNLLAPQVCIIKPTDLPSIEELMTMPAPTNVGKAPFRFIPNGQPLKGFGEVSWQDYSEVMNINTYCCVFHENDFHVGPVTESHGAVIRVGAGDRGRVSLNKIVFRSPPFEKPDAHTLPDGTVISAHEASLRRVKELYDQLTKFGWPAGNQRPAIKPLEIPEEKVKAFKGMVVGHPECARSGGLKG